MTLLAIRIGQCGVGEPVRRRYVVEGVRGVRGVVGVRIAPCIVIDILSGLGLDGVDGVRSREAAAGLKTMAGGGP